MEQSEERRGSMMPLLSGHGTCSLCLELMHELHFPKDDILCLGFAVGGGGGGGVVVIWLYEKELLCRYVVINIYRHTFNHSLAAINCIGHRATPAQPSRPLHVQRSLP
jgi:hypothetical protein